MKIAKWLSSGTKTLQSAHIESARLDCLILLEDCLDLSRAMILTHLDEKIPDHLRSGLDENLNRRKNREPLAYIRGVKEFYGRDFKVNNSVLIPRPESETIIEIAKNLPLKNNSSIADIGTGSGVLAITLALELQNKAITAYDIDADALRTAKINNKTYNTHVIFVQNNLLENSDTSFDCIVANLPYVSKFQNVSEETIFEPQVALYAESDGLALITKLIDQITMQSIIKPDGFLILESEPRQHNRVKAYANANNLKLLKTDGFVQLFQLRSI